MAPNPRTSMRNSAKRSMTLGCRKCNQELLVLENVLNVFLCDFFGADYFWIWVLPRFGPISYDVPVQYRAMGVAVLHGRICQDIVQQNAVGAVKCSSLSPHLIMDRQVISF
ncbi:hypothetical protein ABKN59_006400 [Abortiporus biennis]